VTGSFDAVADRFAVSSQGFEGRLRAVRPGQWSWPTPCTGWTVRDLVNHMTQGNLSYTRLLQGGTADSTIHTWDLARAIGADEHLDVGLVAWISDHLRQIYAGLAETPVAADTTHRFFAAPRGAVADDASRQDRLLHLMGRTPGHDP
jgi:uncharacterized damage-inducible protein DinB